LISIHVPRNNRGIVPQGDALRDSPCRWVIVAAGGAMGCVVMGALFALPVLLGR